MTLTIAFILIASSAVVFLYQYLYDRDLEWPE